MNKKKRIACFFTAGYTELNAMKRFLNKINDQVEYIQLCPSGTRRSKTDIRNRHIDNLSQGGLTGKGLTDYICHFVRQNRFKDEEYDAILIEDDKDERFLQIKQDGTAATDRNLWENHKKEISEQIHSQYPEIPILFLYAAPEVEAWFLADWENSFGQIYKDVFPLKKNQYFQISFRKYVNEEILTDRYSGCIEDYGYFDGTYRKLSEQIQIALENQAFLNSDILKAADSPIRYSKRLQGECMLERLDPIQILKSCSYYFKDGFYALKTLSES